MSLPASQTDSTLDESSLNRSMAVDVADDESRDSHATSEADRSTALALLASEERRRDRWHDNKCDGEPRRCSINLNVFNVSDNSYMYSFVVLS